MDKSRELKFRIWSKRLRNWQDTNTNWHSDAVETFSPPRASFFYCLENIVDDRDFVIQQFTGLKDKSGRPIYEGDIIQYCGPVNISYALPAEVSIGEYFTHAKGFPHYGARVKRIDMDSYFGVGGMSQEYKVIGNIIENPELVKYER